jgi:hypothetical protein
MNIEGGLMARNQTILNCPQCGQTGVADWGKSKTHRQSDLVSLSAGFSSVDSGDKAGHYFACQSCRTVALERSLERAA